MASSTQKKDSHLLGRKLPPGTNIKKEHATSTEISDWVATVLQTHERAHLAPIVAHPPTAIALDENVRQFEVEQYLETTPQAVMGLPATGNTEYSQIILTLHNGQTEYHKHPTKPILQFETATFINPRPGAVQATYLPKMISYTKTLSGRKAPKDTDTETESNTDLYFPCPRVLQKELLLDCSLLNEYLKLFEPEVQLSTQNTKLNRIWQAIHFLALSLDAAKNLHSAIVEEVLGDSRNVGSKYSHDPSKT